MPPTRTVIRPHTRDQHLTPLPVDFNPGTIGWVLAEGARGNIALQNQLFNTMEDTWDRLRSDLNKLKQAVCKLPFNVQPWAEKGREPSAEALEKAAFVEHVLHNQKAKTWEGQKNFHGTIYELLDAVTRGISVLEIEWELSGCYYIPVGTRRVTWSCIGFEKPNALRGAKGTKGANPNSLRLYPDRDPGNPKRFEQYPHKFLVGIYKGKSGSIGETAQLRSLAHLWLGRMLGWEWMAQKAELFGIPVRWATYNPNASQDQINAVTSMLENMGTAAWGAFPEGTKLEVIQGNLSGVAGSNEPNERLAFLADRACDLLFLGQTLTTIEGKNASSYALGNVHRQVELDLYENYAAYIVDLINNKFIPGIIELNWGDTKALPFLDVELDRPEKDHQMAQRDKLLFQDMGLPVASQWLYERHKIPAPGPDEDLYNPNPNPDRNPNPHQPEDLHASKQTTQNTACLHAHSESNQDFNSRKSEAQSKLNYLIKTTDLNTQELVWTGGDCPVCAPFNGTTYPDGWTSPPPLHHNCDCTIEVRAKAEE